MRAESTTDNKSRKIKVIFLSHSAELAGGAEICLLTLLRHLDKEAIEPIVIFPTEGPFRGAVGRLCIKTYVVPLEWWVETEYGIPFQDDSFLERVRIIGEIIEKERPDILHTNTSVIWEGAVAARLNNVRHLWHIHEVLDGHPSLTPVLPISLFYRVMADFSDRVVTVSDAEKRDLTRYIPSNKLTTIHNGVDAGTGILEAGALLRDELSIPSDWAIALTLASLAQYKGLDTLLETALLVKDNKEKIRFVLAGSGTEDETELLNGKIVRLGLEGFVSYLGFRRDVEHLLEGSDFLVVSSIKESFSLVTAEAMAAGKPVITTDCGGPAELVLDGETGFIVPIGDPASLREKMLQLAADKEIIRTMGENGRRRFKECFTAEIHAEKFLHFYQEMMRSEELPAISHQEGALLLDFLSAYQKHVEKMKSLVEKDRTIEQKKQEIADLEWQVAERNQQLEMKEIILQQKEGLLQQKEEMLKHRSLQLKYKEEIISGLYNSLSWRVTKPLRALHSSMAGALLYRGNHSGKAAVEESAFDLDDYYQKDPLVREALAAKNDTYDLLVFPVIAWHFRFQRPQHLSRQLAALGHRVFYLTLEFSDEWTLPSFRILESPEKNIFIVQLTCSKPLPRSVYRETLSPEQLQFLVASLARLQHVCGLGQLVSMVDLPFWRPIAEALPGSLLVYDCMDHHAGFSTNTREMLKQERLLLEDADLVLTTSQKLSDIIARDVPNVIIRNGAEVAFFAREPSELAYCSDRPVVGYFGAISEWFDMEIVVASARAFPEWDFVLVGSTFGSDTRRARKVTNIKFVGEVPYASLPGYLHAFDVCIIPFKLTELTLCTNPVKVYEYLSAGKPVVSTAMPEVKLMADQVHIAGSVQEFIEKLKIAMVESENEGLARTRSDWVFQHDWQERARELDAGITAFLPKVSVVVLTYNNIDLTRECLASLLEYTRYPDWELIIVDNASTDGSPEFLRGFAEGRQQTRLILNKANLGFAAGNNIGMQEAKGEFLVILNNDTFVTGGWLFDLVSHLRRDEKLGIVGPVTNSIGNEAQIQIAYSGMSEMQVKAREYTSRHKGKLIDASNLAFFCIALRRRVWQEIGPLDEAFTVGFFEDDDYCNRIKGAGLKLAIAEDVFVHHQHSASFNTLSPEKKNEIFERNKRVYEQKWGEWVPHVYRRGR